MPQRKASAAEAALVAFLDRLPMVRVGVNNYTKTDRARDFIATFRESESGRRVFAQIAAICDPYIGVQDADKPGKLAWAAAQRHVLAQIMHAMIAPQEDTDVSEDA